MMIRQLSVFLENKKGRLAEVTRSVAIVSLVVDLHAGVAVNAAGAALPAAVVVEAFQPHLDPGHITASTCLWRRG